LLQPPIITLADPHAEGETSIDPLGLARTYERLADRILPAVTVRMGRIRFVTAMCLGALVCRDYSEDAVAADGVTPPWLVFEWFLIEAFARVDDEVRGHGIPGLNKARSCMEAQRPLSAAYYLKTPKVFGFNGVFRRLATGTKILTDELALDDGGWDLMRAWEREADLPGLVDGRTGSGAALVRDLKDAVKAGLAGGHTVKRPGTFWEALARDLHPNAIGKREGQLLRDRVRSSDPLTSIYVDALTERGGISVDQEPAFVRKTAPKVAPELGSCLRAIDAYEAMCRPLDTAFDLVCHLSAKGHGAPVDETAYATSLFAAPIVDDLRTGLRRVEDDPTLLTIDDDARLRTVIDRFRDAGTPQRLFHAVLDHHERVQREKPPDGKRPWIERARKDSAMVRPGFGIVEWKPSPGYVHNYRGATVTRFLKDVGAVK
jgi:hypothetical protein